MDKNKISTQTKENDVPLYVSRTHIAFQFIKYLLGLILLIGLPLLYLYQENKNSKLDEIRLEKQITINDLHNNLQSQLDSLPKILDSVSKSTSENLNSIPELEKILLATISWEKGLIYEMHYIGQDGFEKIKIKSQNQAHIIAPKNKLKNKKQHPYFRDTIDLKAGEVHISPIDYHVEHDDAEKEILAFRICTPVFEKITGIQKGIIVLDYSLDHLLHAIRGIPPSEVLPLTSLQFNAIIDLAGRQRMLTQKTLKDLLFKKILPSTTTTNTNFHIALKKLRDDIVNFPLSKTTTNKMSDLLQQTDSIWRQSELRINNINRNTDIAELNKTSLQLLNIIDQVVTLFEEESKKHGYGSSKTINIAGLQRMLTQKMTKEKLIIHLNGNAEIALKESMEVFQENQEKLYLGTDGIRKATGQAREQLEKIQGIWIRLKPLLQKTTLTQAELEQLYALNLNLLEMSDLLVQLYEKQSPSSTNDKFYLYSSYGIVGGDLAQITHNELTPYTNHSRFPTITSGSSQVQHLNKEGLHTFATLRLIKEGDLQVISLLPSYIINETIRKQLETTFYFYLIILLLGSGFGATLLTKNKLSKETEIRHKKTLEKTNNQLQEAIVTIKSVAKSKGEFMAGMAHELRTPLNSFLLLSKNLSENKKGNLIDEQIEDLKIIHDGGTVLLNLINDLMDLSKGEAGKLIIYSEIIELQGICQQISKMFNPSAKKKGLEFRITIKEDTPKHITTDALRLEQILRNFISNSIKFTEKGRIQLIIHRPEGFTNFFNTSLTPQNSIAFSVIDTGIGIPKEKQEEVFKAFQQQDDLTTQKYGGTGLGLTISKVMAGLLGGEIHLESKSRKGCKFTLYLPLKRDKLPPIDKTLESKAFAGTDKKPDKPPMPIKISNEDLDLFRNKKILLTDNDIRNLYALSSDLQGAGFKVLETTSGTAALDKLKKEDNINLIIMMSVLDGDETISKIRQQNEHKDISIIAATDDATPNNTKSGTEAGANDYLSKPIDYTELLEMIKRLL